MSPFYKGDAFLSVRGASGARDNTAERLVVVFQFYLDDSGTSGLPSVSMSGFLARLDQWEKLEPELDAILNEQNVAVLHAKEFHDTKGVFAGWSKIRKRTLAERLFSAAHGRIYGVSMMVRRSFREGARKKLKGVKRMSAYGICFSSIMMRAITDPQIGPSVRKAGVAFLVESGNKNNAEIEQYFHQMSKADTFEGCFRSITFLGKTSCRAIQIADFLAFYSRRHMIDTDKFDGKLALPASPYLEIMKRHVPILQRVATGAATPVGHLDRIPNLDALTALTRA